MTISYDFVAFSGRLSENSWTLGMKAIQGEVPLDIVIPNLQTPSASEDSDDDDKDIIGVLTKEGISRESTDVMELYRYLRQLNPKYNQAFGYNEVAIRNIHSRLNALKIDEELRVQITYTERKESYIPASYSIKLLGIFHITAADPSVPASDSTENIDIDPSEEKAQDEDPIIPKDFPRIDPDVPVYKTTNTLEKLIVFTRTLQSELKETQQNLALMTERLKLLEEERQHYQEQENLLQEIFERLNHLESFEKRIHSLEDTRHQLNKLQQTLVTYFRTSNRQTRTLLNEVNDETENINSDT